jgi:glyoxylase-like metal-dependent hydrolase (beta-lactamase superfamily II)
VHRITLGNTEFEGHNVAYLLDGDDSVALVDTGVATAEVRDQLEAALADHGLAFADVDDVVLTHWHMDHTGLAGAVQRAGETTVYVHHADAPLVGAGDDAWSALHDRQRACFEDWGMPAAKRDELLAFLDGQGDLRGEPVEVTAIADGDTLHVGGRELEVRHAPGHTAGSCVLAFDGEQGREALVGDAVLPEYTPNVGGADVRVERPLATYLDTLDALAARDYDRLWPGHRDLIDDPADRIHTIAEHHHERTERVVGVLREHGPVDAWTVSAHLFGDLAGIHVMHGPGEAYAHLDYLVEEEVVERDGGEYRLRDDADAERADVL